MATQSSKTGLPKFFAGDQSPEKLRQQFIDSPMEAAGQPALATLGELAALMSILPEAFAASQRRELERVKRSGPENDPRVAALETSIEQTLVFQSMVRQGQTRAQRTLVAVAGKDTVFHGFVSEADLTPLKGVTVRLISTKSTSSRGLSAITDADGYFSISLGPKAGDKRDSGAKSGPVGVSQRLNDLVARQGREPNSFTAINAEAETSRVEILLKGKLLHTDEVLIAHDAGSIYREYVIGDTESPAPESRKVSLGQASKRQGPKEGKATATEPLKGEAAKPESASLAEPGAEKKSRRGAKTSKPKSKK